MPTAATTVYTDGACVGNPGPGGWAWAVPGGRWASGPDPQTTNQRMEITAVLEAARAIDGPIDVVSDSTYVVNCWRDRWWEAWLRKGWVNSQRKPVANRDLWEPLVEIFRSGRVTMRWVKGHSGDSMNDVVDRLAVEAARTQQPAAGDTPPTELPAPDTPSGAAGRDRRLPAGRLLVVTGHRPPELGGYDDNPVRTAVLARLVDVVRAKRTMHPDLHVVTGMGLGAEQLGAEAAIEAAVPFVAVLPYPEPQAVWPAATRLRYDGLLAAAAGRVVLQAKAPESKQQAGAAMARRDAWLARNADEAVVVWDGEDERIGRVVRSLTDHLGEEEVWVEAPPPDRGRAG